MKRVKENMQVVLEKSATDDELLEALQTEVQRLRKSQQAAVAAAAAAGPSTTTTTVNLGKHGSTITTARIATRDAEGGSKAAAGSGAGAGQDEQLLIARQAAEIQRLQRLCKNQVTISIAE